MPDSQFSIPEEFRSEVHDVDALDKRPDEEILDGLEKYVTVISEKNVWTY